VEKLECRATFLNGRYRLDRLVVAHDDVTIWDATDLARGLSVQLSVFERGAAVLDEGRIGSGMFVATGTSSRTPRLELALDDDEEEKVIAIEPRPRRRSWPWAAAGLACALLAFAGWYAASARSHPVSETTITVARLPAPEIAMTPPPPPLVIAKPPELPRVVDTPVVREPKRRETPPPLPRPVPQKPRRVTPRAPVPAAPSYDPLTI